MAVISDSKTAYSMRNEVVEYYDNEIRRETNALDNLKSLGKYEREKRQAVIARLSYDREFWLHLYVEGSQHKSLRKQA